MRLLILALGLFLFSCETGEEPEPIVKDKTDKKEVVESEGKSIKEDYIGCWEPLNNKDWYSVCIDSNLSATYIETPITLDGGEIINKVLLYEIKETGNTFWFNYFSDTLEYNYNGSTQESVYFKRI